MHAELLTIGSELLSGATVNTNASDLARRLAEAGLPCRRQIAVSDERPRILAALQDSLRRCDILLVTGGLGPTFDDCTMEAIAAATGRPLVYHPPIAACIRRFYRRHHRQLQRAALRQAYLPQGGVALANPIGTAPGLWLALPRQLVIALPGVPREMRAMMVRSVLPRLRRRPGAATIATRTLRTSGIVELAIETLLHRLRLPAELQIGLYPHLRLVDVRLTAVTRSAAASRRLLRHAERRLRRGLGAHVYGVDGDTLAGTVGARLLKHRTTLAVAESCTGGLVMDQLTNVSGSSRYLRGGVVAYHNALKQGLLGVPDAVLQRFGAVSASTAKAMAAGVRRAAGAGLGLSITGIAGPTGGRATKPVGLVYLGLADGRRTHTQRHQFFGDREAIKAQAAQAALDWLRCCLR